MHRVGGRVILSEKEFDAMRRQIERMQRQLDELSQEPTRRAMKFAAHPMSLPASPELDRLRWAMQACRASDQEDVLRNFLFYFAAQISQKP